MAVWSWLPHGACTRPPERVEGPVSAGLAVVVHAGVILALRQSCGADHYARETTASATSLALFPLLERHHRSRDFRGSNLFVSVDCRAGDWLRRPVRRRARSLRCGFHPVSRYALLLAPPWRYSRNFVGGFANALRDNLSRANEA